MSAPQVDRPFMPSYGVLGADEGHGLLAWSTVEARLARAHDYWLATTWPDGRPHVMPVWGVVLDSTVWFSTSLQSRKWKNLARDPRCTITSDDAYHPVIIDGTVEVTRDEPAIQRFLDALNAKYATSYGLDFQDPDVNATLRVAPHTVISLDEDDFTGTPTRFRFA